MGESHDASTNVDLDALRALQADAQELERIQSLIGRFNVFEAIGFVGQELMHSQFLASFLDPKQNHGLGDLFLKRVLREVLASADNTLLSAFFESLDEMDLNETLVRREHQHIDLLLTNEAHKLAVVIENKIWTTEHSDQLGRYHRLVQRNHPDWRVFGIYLTPHGYTPSHEAYRPLGYGVVCEIIDSVLTDRGSTLIPDVKMSLEHYVQMVRRHIVGDSEIARLCQQIYQKHKRALDLIYEHRPDRQAANRDILTRLVKNTEVLLLTGKSRRYVWFHPHSWEVPALQVNDDRLGFFRFVFQNNPDRLDLYLETSPGDERTRRRLFEMGQKDEELFNHLADPNTGRYPSLYRRTFLAPQRYQDASDSELEQEIHRQWDEFLKEDLPRIEAALKAETWIWASTKTEGSASIESPEIT